MPSLLLLGSSDLTAAVAETLSSTDVPVGAVVSPSQEFRISYSPNGISNSRFFDMRGWCDANSCKFIPYEKPDDIVRAAKETGAVAALAVGWYHMVPARVRSVFPLGCLGIHASLLPKYRGGAPLNWAVLNGDSETGVSLFELSDGVDNGLLFAQESFLIEPNDYVGDLVRKVESVSMRMLAATVSDWLNGKLRGYEQIGAPTYSLQRQPSDGLIDWTLSAEAIRRLVRAVSRPYPGAYTYLDSRRIVIWRANVVDVALHVYGACGQIARIPDLSAPLVVTGDGLLSIEEIEGDAGFSLMDFARSHQRRLDNGR